MAVQIKNIYLLLYYNNFHWYGYNYMVFFVQVCNVPVYCIGIIILLMCYF